MERDSSKGGKKGFEWVLEEWAVSGGVESTTRYRKPGSGKRLNKSELPEPQLQLASKKRKNSSIHKGRPLAKSRRRERGATSADAGGVETNEIVDLETLHSPDPTDAGINFEHDTLAYVPGYTSALPLANDLGTTGLPNYSSPDFPDNLSPEPQSLDCQYPFDIEGVDDVRKDLEGTSFFCPSEKSEISSPYTMNFLASIE